MIEGALLHFRMMEEYISPIIFDESETAVADDFLDLSLWHNLTPQNRTGFSFVTISRDAKTGAYRFGGIQAMRSCSPSRISEDKGSVDR